MTERALATIRRIAEIRPHTNADALELAVIDGWQVVVKKGEFQKDQKVVYFEIDSWIPTEIAPFLSKGKEPREYEGVKGERLRTIKLRQELSQGLVLPLSIVFPQHHVEVFYGDGADVTELLGIKKWEKPLNPQLAGQARGYFPSFLRKTDQPRIQNLFHKLTPEQKEDWYEVTLKIDGSSMTVYHKDGEVGVCSRNLELKIDDSNKDNAFVKMFYELKLDEKLKSFGRNIALQGELWGSGINGNWEGVSNVRFSLFDVFDIDKQSYLPALERREIAFKLGLASVPLIEFGSSLSRFNFVDELLDFSDRPSIYNKVAEGVVFKSTTNPDFSFKVINNKYLLNGGE